MMDAYGFKSVMAQLKTNFEKVRVGLERVGVGPAADAEREKITRVWYYILQDVHIDAATQAINRMLHEESQPKSMEGFPRRVLAYAKDYAKDEGFKKETWGTFVAAAEYLQDMKATAGIALALKLATERSWVPMQLVEAVRHGKLTQGEACEAMSEDNHEVRLDAMVAAAAQEEARA